jgi:hypothetical protein
MQRLKERFLKIGATCDFNTQFLDGVNQVHLSSLWGLWLILAVAIAVAFTFACSKWAWHKWRWVRTAPEESSGGEPDVFKERAKEMLGSASGIVRSFRRSSDSFMSRESGSLQSEYGPSVAHGAAPTAQFLPQVPFGPMCAAAVLLTVLALSSSSNASSCTTERGAVSLAPLPRRRVRGLGLAEEQVLVDLFVSTGLPERLRAALSRSGRSRALHTDDDDDQTVVETVRSGPRGIPLRCRRRVPSVARTASSAGDSHEDNSLAGPFVSSESRQAQRGVAWHAGDDRARAHARSQRGRALRCSTSPLGSINRRGSAGQHAGMRLSPWDILAPACGTRAHSGSPTRRFASRPRASFPGSLSPGAAPRSAGAGGSASSPPNVRLLRRSQSAYDHDVSAAMEAEHSATSPQALPSLLLQRTSHSAAESAAAQRAASLVATKERAQLDALLAEETATVGLASQNTASGRSSDQTLPTATQRERALQELYLLQCAVRSLLVRLHSVQELLARE